MIKYIEHKTLRERDSTRSSPDSAVDGILLVGEHPALVYDTGHDIGGHDRAELYPAVHNGSRSWLLRRTWQPAIGYSAYGTQDLVLKFEEGITTLVEHGVFAFPMAQSDK